MARGRYGFLALFVVVTALYLVALAVWHDSIPHILAVVALFGTVTVGLFTATSYCKNK